MKFCPQRPHRAQALIQADPGRFARHARLIADWQRRRVRRFGPYYRLRYRDPTQLRSVCLGREGPLVEQVRQALAALRAPGQRHRTYQRQRR